MKTRSHCTGMKLELRAVFPTFATEILLRQMESTKADMFT